MPVSVIILAAGSSSRMGQSKQLLPWGNETLLGHAINTALQCRADFVLVVLGHDEIAHRKAIAGFPVSTIVNPQWQKGIGSSIKEGLRSTIEADAVLFMTCDMPFVTADHLNKIIETDHPIVASKYEDAIGVPALFRKEMYDKLLRIRDDEGARKLILDHKPKVVDLKSGIDLDTPEDYQRALSN
ncbi:MAG: nucleotidyltransferase family protein [Bacteroidota bacterium]